MMTKKKKKRDGKEKKGAAKRHHQSRTIASVQNSASRRENYGRNSRGCT
jgi:hypothetical protein